ncbi:MAG: PAS domain-containing protein [Pseudomonadota bacterium]
MSDRVVGLIDAEEIVATLRESLLVLDVDLVVEYASERFFETFHVSREDTIGRPLGELGNGQWNIPALLEPLGRIVEGGASIERHKVDHVFDGIGRRVMELNARKTVRPGNGSKRILLAIDDITDAELAAQELDRRQRVMTGMVQTLREPLLVLDGDLRVVEASRAFYQTFKVEADGTIGEKLWDLGNGQWAIPELIHLLTSVIPTHSDVEDYEVNHTFPEIGRKTILLNARKIYREGNGTKTLLLAMQDVTDRKAAEEAREKALTLSNTLLEELNHRVMNNLGMVGAIVGAERTQMTDEQCRAAFERMRARISSLGQLYKTLSRTGAIANVDSRDYLDGVLRNLLESSSSAKDIDIALTVDIASMQLSTLTALPLGLVINELATNSLKYAYAGRPTGELGVSLACEGDTLILKVWDDGVGIDPSARVDSGMGQKLIKSLVRQLGAKTRLDSGATGTCTTLTFPRTLAKPLPQPN